MSKPVAFPFRFRSYWHLNTRGRQSRPSILRVALHAVALRNAATAAVRNSPPLARLRTYGANVPPARRLVGYFSSKIANNLRGFGLSPPATSEQTLYRLLRRLFMPVAKKTSFVRSPMPTVSKVRGAHSLPYHPAIILAGNTV